MTNAFVRWIAEHGAPQSWRQAGADFACSVLDRGDDVEVAMRAIVELAACPAKVTIPTHGADGRIIASQHLDLDTRATMDAQIGALYAIAYRRGHADASSRLPTHARPRSIGFLSH